MDEDPRHEVTRILRGLGAGEPDDRGSRDRLFEILYSELHAIAGRLMRQERPGQTIQPTALVHEAYLALVDKPNVHWQDQGHFFGVAARVMRHILVDRARSRAAAKHGGQLQRVTFEDDRDEVGGPDVDVLALDEALGRLAQLDERMHRVVELRVFSGLGMDQIARALGVSRRTVYNDWDVAKRWLARELVGEP